MQKQKIPKVCGVYKITSPTERVYIGSSINIKNRHSSYSSCPSKKQKLLYRSILKYGFINHTFEIVQTCKPDERLALERKYGEEFNAMSANGGLNLILPKDGDIPASYSKETIERFKEIARNRRPTKETKEKYRIAKLGLYKNGLHPMARIILNTQTGIYYECIKEAAISVNLKRSTLSMKLTGKNFNNTNLVYV